MKHSIKILSITIIGLMLGMFSPAKASAQPFFSYQNWCQIGGQQVMLAGLPSTNVVQQSFPRCTVSVFLTGTLTLAPIYSDGAGTILANPFTANADASFKFYAAQQIGYDITISGSGIPAPRTFVDVCLACGTGGGSGALFPNAVAPVVSLTTTTSRSATFGDIVGLFGGTCTGTNVLQANGVCGPGGGGSGNVLATPQFRIFIQPNSGTQAVAGGATTTLNAVAPILQGTQDTDSFGSATAAQAAAACTSLFCSVETSAASTSTEIGQPLPVLGNKVSSAWRDNRYDSIAGWMTNPVPAQTGLSLFPLQTPTQVAFPSAVAYTTPFPPGYSTPDFPTGLFEGSQQNGAIYAHSFCCGYSLGNLDSLTPTPLPGYPGASPWAGFGGETHLDQFFGTGIRQASTWITNFLGTGDAQTNAWFCNYAGGAISVSDEGIHCLGSIHASTPSDTAGAVASIIDSGATTGLMKIRLNITANPKFQGQGRFMYGAPVFTTFADKITNAAPGSQTPGTVVFNDITLPASPTWGFMTNYCDSGVQDIGVGIGKNSGTPGCAVTVQHGQFCAHGSWNGSSCPTTGVPAPVCTSFNVGGLWNFGSVVTAATSLIGGQQTLTMTMHKPAPATAVVYQGGTCGMGVHWIADDAFGENAGNNTVSGSVLPSIGSTDAHTMLMPIAIIASSHAGTREIVNDFGGPTPGPHAEGFNVDLTRSSNIVHGLLEQGSFLPSQFWFDQLFFQVANCTDTSFNGQIGSLAGMPGPSTLNIQWAQTGADSAGCTGAKIYPITAQVAIVQMAEIYSVSDPAVDGSVSAANTVNGYIAAGVNDYFLNPGNSATIPTHPVAGGDVLNLNAQFTQPLLGMTGLNIIQQYNSMEGTSTGITISTFNKLEAQFGSGGNATPMTAVYIHAPTGFPVLYALRTDFSPHFLGAGIKFGPCPGYWDTANDTFCNYAMISASGTQGEDTLAIVDKPRQDTIAFHLKKDATDDISFSRVQSKFNVPTAFSDFEVESNVGGVFGGNFIPTQSLSQCTTFEVNGTSPGPGPCWHRITTALGSAVPTTPGSPFTTRLFYVMIGHDSDGLTASGEYLENFSPAPITPTFSNTITCLDLPSGVTGAKIYLVQPGIALLPVTGGNCNAPTDVVIDTGVYDSPLGPSPWIAGIPLFSGGFYGNTLAFLNADQFGTSSNIPTAYLTQTAAGTFLFSGATRNDGLGLINAAGLGSGFSSNTDLTGELSFATATTATYSFTKTYVSHPICVPSPEATTAGIGSPWVTYTGVASFTVNFPAAFTGSVGYVCVSRN